MNNTIVHLKNHMQKIKIYSKIRDFNKCSADIDLLEKLRCLGFSARGFYNHLIVNKGAFQI